MRIALLMIALVGCGGAPRGGGRGAAPAAANLDEAWPLAGPRCQSDVCSCRRDGDTTDERPPSPPLKRYELRSGRTLDATEVLIDGRLAHRRKTDHPEEQCSYVDLPPGRHQLALRVRAREPEQGIAPSLKIAEFGVAAASWYHTLELACGVTEACLKDDLRAELDRLRAVPRGLHDPCGATRVEKVSWAAERSPGVKLEDLVFEATLHVYEFQPREPTGGAACRGRDRGM